MNITAPRRAAHAGRPLTQPNPSRRPRCTLPAVGGRGGDVRVVARWTATADGRLVRSWRVAPRGAMGSKASEDPMPEPDPRSRRPGAHVRRRVKACS
jgi:hypothetical protein